MQVKKLLFDAKLEHDCVKNYKVLQQIFEKKNIAKNIPVEKLIKGKPLDNLEMLQVMFVCAERRESACAGGRVWRCPGRGEGQAEQLDMAGGRASSSPI